MFIQIEKNPDGSHAFQVGGVLENGWAAIPENMELPDSFPYVNIEVAEITHPAVIATSTKQVDGKLVEYEKVLVPEFTQLEVVSMTDGEEIPVEESVIEFTVQDDIDAMLVDQEFRLTLLELDIAK